MAVARRLLGIEGIDVLKMRCRGVETVSVEDQVPVGAELNPVATAGHHAFDVELVLRQVVNAFGFKDDNFAALRRAEVVGDPVNKEMISGANPEFHDVLALAEGLVTVQPGASFQGPGGRGTIIRREPDDESLPSDYDLLPDVED